MVRNMTINRAKVKQGRRFEIRPLLLRRCSRVALGLLRLSFGNISVMSRFSPGDASVQNHTSEHNVSMMIRSIMLMVMMLTFGTTVSWGQICG